MALTVINNSWTLSEVSNTQQYTKTLKTAGTFVDKNIVIDISAKQGEVTVDSQEINVTPAIEKDSDNNYIIKVEKAVSIVPTVTEGWVAPKDVHGSVVVGGELQMASTTLTGRLKPMDTASGYSTYSIVASKGYNDTDLESEINVYQGDFI